MPTADRIAACGSHLAQNHYRENRGAGRAPAAPFRRASAAFATAILGVAAVARRWQPGRPTSGRPGGGHRPHHQPETGGESSSGLSRGRCVWLCPEGPRRVGARHPRQSEEQTAAGQRHDTRGGPTHTESYLSAETPTSGSKARKATVEVCSDRGELQEQNGADRRSARFFSKTLMTQAGRGLPCPECAGAGPPRAGGAGRCRW
ncbi:uncharacterized protein LOC118238203 [Cricetulus griseus]|uniref:Uncharacterized protein LOC118238203 n=1 Tax=Cricetulus griseus TaxID=10029 RepID=A0A9J7GMS1_CRIGR|nr:uncharacterized protein LOC118238203 [Cricetulus griseus]